MNKAMDTAYLPQKDNTKLAIWIFLGGEVIFFTTLILGYVFYRLTVPAEAYAEFNEHLQTNLTIIAANTFILIASSYLVVRGLEAIRKDDQKGMRLNLIGVLVLGAIFVGGQAIEWLSLFREGITVPESVIGSAFFVTTGVHGTHVVVGLLWGIIVLVNAFRGAYSKRYYLDMEMFGLYWHFVDIVWIVLFTLLYLI